MDLGINLLGLLSIIAWAGFWSSLIFGTMKYFKILRIDEHTEIMGNDIVKHGEAAYPKDAWIEMQYQSNPNLPPNMTEIAAEDFANYHNAIKEGNNSRAVILVNGIENNSFQK